jgi:phospholipase C
MDQFVEHTEMATCAPPIFAAPGIVMGYYDGNSVTALWNYAQHHAMNDSSYNSTSGPSAPGHLNLVSGQTHGVIKEFMPTGKLFPPNEVIENAGNGQGALIGDAQPFGDDCSSRDQVQLSNTYKNIGDLLNAKDVTWGYFQCGFKPTSTEPDGTAACGSTHNVGTALGGTGKSGPLPFGTKDDYIPHHEPFQYYSSTANPHHLPPNSIDTIGHSDQANHQYDLSDFESAADAGNLPAVSFLKPPSMPPSPHSANWSCRCGWGWRPVRPNCATGTIFGTVLNWAARVIAAGHGGQILVADSTAVLRSGVDLLDLRRDGCGSRATVSPFSPFSRRTAAPRVSISRTRCV